MVVASRHTSISHHFFVEPCAQLELLRGSRCLHIDAGDLGKGRAHESHRNLQSKCGPAPPFLPSCSSHFSNFPNFPLPVGDSRVRPRSSSVPVPLGLSPEPICPMGPPQLPGKLHFLSLGDWASPGLPTGGCAGGPSRRSLNTISFWAMPLPLSRAHVETHNRDSLCSLADRFVALWGRK